MFVGVCFLSVISASIPRLKLPLLVAAVKGRYNESATLEDAIDHADSLMASLPTSLKASEALRIADGVSCGCVHLSYLLSLCRFRDQYGGVTHEIEAALQASVIALTRMEDAFSKTNVSEASVSSLAVVADNLNNARAGLANKRRLLRSKKPSAIVEDCVDAWDRLCDITLTVESAEPLSQLGIFSGKQSDILPRIAELMCQILSVFQKLRLLQFEAEMRHLSIVQTRPITASALETAAREKTFATSIAVAVAFGRRVDCLGSFLPELISIFRKYLLARYGLESEPVRVFKIAIARFDLGIDWTSVGLVNLFTYDGKINLTPQPSDPSHHECATLMIRQFVSRWLVLVSCVEVFSYLKTIVS